LTLRSENSVTGKVLFLKLDGMRRLVSKGRLAA